MSKVQGAGMIFHSENLDVHRKGVLHQKCVCIKFPNIAAVNDMLNTTSNASQKKGGRGPGQRKALQDISNASSLWQEALTKKKSNMEVKYNFAEEDFNIAKEGYLHDHKKCMRSKEAAMDPYQLWRDGFIFPSSPPKPKQAEARCASPPSLKLEPVPELEKRAGGDWCYSPIHSPPQSQLWFDLPEFQLNPFVDDQIQ